MGKFMIVYYRDDNSIGVQWADTFEEATNRVVSLKVFENIKHIYITKVEKVIYMK